MTTPSAGGVCVLDLRGEPDGRPKVGRVVVIDHADTLAEHWDVYLKLAGDWLVSGVICLAVGEPGRGVDGDALHSSVVLRVPAVLTNEKGAVLWVGDEEGVVWAARSDHAAPVTAGPLSGLDDPDGPRSLTGLERLKLALSVEEVFDAVRDRVREFPDRAANPGLVVFSGAPVPDDLRDACSAALSELTTARPDRRPPVELHQALASLGVNPRLQISSGATGDVAAARARLSVAHATAEYLAGAVGSRWLFRRRLVPGVVAEAGVLGEDGVRPGPDLAVWVVRASRAAVDYREKAHQLVNRIDGQLRRRDTTVPQVIEAGAPEPTQVAASEVAADLADAVARHLAHDPALPSLATHLQREAAAQAPAGCPGAVARLRPDAGEPPIRGIPPGWPVSPGLAPVVLLTCAVAVFVPTPHWIGWLLGLLVLLAWFVPAWLLLARWPADDGERGIESAAASSALAVGLPGLVGIGLGLLGIRYLGEAPLTTGWRIGLVAGAFVLVWLAVQGNWALAAHRVRKAVDLDPLEADLHQVTALVGDVLRDEWVPSARRRLVAGALHEVADGLYEIEQTLVDNRLCGRRGPTSGTVAAALPDGVARAVPAELQAVVRDDLLWLVRAALDRARRATESGNRAHRDEYRRRAERLLAAYSEHLDDRGLLTLPCFADLPEPTPDPTARDQLLTQVWGEAPRAREALRMRDTDEMTQLCSGAQLGDLSTYGESVMVRFAPRPVRDLVAGAGPRDQVTDHLAEMVWTTRAELVGVLRLITLQPGAREVVQAGSTR